MMRRNMQLVLERWGSWAASEERCSRLDWPALSVFPCAKLKAGRPGCSDEDGLVVDSSIARMSRVRPVEDILILGQRFIGGFSTRFSAEVTGLSRMEVRTSLRASEEFLEGVLVSLGVHLDMDLEVMLTEGLRAPVNTCYVAKVL